MQPIVIHGKMDGNKVQNHADLILMAGIDELFQLCRCSIPGGGAEKPRILIAPGLVRRMLTDGQQLNMISSS